MQTTNLSPDDGPAVPRRASGDDPDRKLKHAWRLYPTAQRQILNALDAGRAPADELVESMQRWTDRAESLEAHTIEGSLIERYRLSLGLDESYLNVP
jgi:hypothetical protein